MASDLGPYYILLDGMRTDTQLNYNTILPKCISVGPLAYSYKSDTFTFLKSFKAVKA